jgi:hypothetical protein
MGWLDRGSRSIRGDKIESRAKAYPSNVIDMLIVSEGKSGSSGQTITGPTLDPANSPRRWLIDLFNGAPGRQSLNTTTV